MANSYQVATVFAINYWAEDLNDAAPETRSEGGQKT